MKRALPILFIILLSILPGCRPPGGDGELDEAQRDRLDLIDEIKAFENKLGFAETENFKVCSDNVEAYDYYFYTSQTALPYSLDDPLLQRGKGKPESSPIDLAGYDLYFYAIQAVAGVKTPVTKSLLRAPLHRFIHVVLHEDWHEQMNSSLGIEEPCAEVVSYPAAVLFAEKEFGRDSKVYERLKDDFSKKLEESRLYQHYYDELEFLYGQFHSGNISEAEVLAEKEDLLESMAEELQGLWGVKPRQLNNAFIAFQMTYQRHFSLMYQVYTATGFDLRKTMAIFSSVPEQGTEFSDVQELKNIEAKVTDYLRESARAGREASLSPFWWTLKPVLAS
ncbi:hypothetical protein ACFLXF_00020 [Chloroflexota bacterium]